MAHFMPPSILALFAPNPPIKFLKMPSKKKPIQYTGLSDFITLAKQHSNDPIPKKSETITEKKAKRKRKRKRLNDKRIKKQLETCY